MSIRTLVEFNHDWLANLDTKALKEALLSSRQAMPDGVRLIAQRHHSESEFAVPEPRATPWVAEKLRTRTVVRSVDDGLVCVIEGGADHEQVTAMIAAVNGYARSLDK